MKGNIVLTMECDASAECVKFDLERFGSLLLNLIDNAIKYNRSGGTANVEASVNKENELHLVVEDTGIGIPDSLQHRAFERFFRVDKAHTRLGGGSGLGLSIVKHIVKAHNGTISLRSEQNVGTVFTVKVPME